MGGRGGSSGISKTQALTSKIDKIQGNIKTLQEESLQVLNSRENAWDPVPRRYYELTEKVRGMQKKLFSLQEERSKLRRKENPAPHTFVNSFGEATKREITSASYDRAQRRLDREIDRRFKGR